LSRAATEEGHQSPCTHHPLAQPELLIVGGRRARTQADDEALRSAFAEAQRVVHQSAADALSDSERLQLYGAYKQATVGRNCTKAPMMLDMVASAKWCAP
jgi:hypothetical protein